MLACLDEGVGNVTAALKAEGLWESTVFTDNGAPTPACGGAQGGKNFPLRGGKCSAWEGGLRGTAFVHSALLSKSVQGTELHSLMHATDILPTLLAATHGVTGAALYAGALQQRGFKLDDFDQWTSIASSARGSRSAGPRTQLLMEADPHSLPLDRRYCSDQHGQGPGTAYFAFQQVDSSGKRWKLYELLNNRISAVLPRVISAGDPEV